jgi:adenylate cyclase
MTSESTFLLSQDRLSVLRHDLRSPLSEIIGFAELLLEEAREDCPQNLLEGLEEIRQSAQRILGDVSHSLHPDTLRSSPAVLNSLKQTIQQLADGILRKSQELSDHCDQVGQSAIGDDLLRISGSARRLRESAPLIIDKFAPGGVASEQMSVVSDPSEKEREQPNETTIRNAAGGAILVVDDQETNRDLLARRLRKAGYSVSLAENGRQALERLRARRFDLVLLDIVMPEMDGVEVLRQVKADPQLAHIPVLMLSAVDELAAVVRCIELGATDYLPKPFPPAILDARVESSLANKRMSDQLRKYAGWLFGKTLFSDALSSRGFLELTRQERTILFADIRGFTAWTERRAPEEAVALLNRYFETAERITAESPVIKSEYTGDEIMGIFADAAEAVRIGQELSRQLGSQLLETNLGIGVGLHTGPVIEGLMGGADVKAYRFVGDTVNTAKRISSSARAGQVLLSAQTFQKVKDSIRTGPSFQITVKGKAEPLEIWPLADS